MLFSMLKCLRMIYCSVSNDLQPLSTNLPNKETPHNLQNIEICLLIRIAVKTENINFLQT